MTKTSARSFARLIGQEVGNPSFELWKFSDKSSDEKPTGKNVPAKPEVRKLGDANELQKRMKLVDRGLAKRYRQKGGG